MSKNKRASQSNTKQVKPSENPLQDQTNETDLTQDCFLKKWGMAILFGFSLLLYANTLGHDYTQDDAIVIYDNMYTQKGLSGIPGLLTKDTFFGFFKQEGKAKLVSGGRYRPLTPIMFAIEYAIFGRSPFIGHLINVLLFGLLGILMYKLLEKIFSYRVDYSKNYNWVIFSIVLLYQAHPIHTEAVANIKGRDEIMALLCSVLATICIIDYIEKTNIKYALYAGLSFFAALMSKENAITFLLIVPLVLVFFYGKSWKEGITRTLPLLAAAILFLSVRTAVLGFDFGGTPMELMNNPYLKWDGNKYISFSPSEKFATIIFTLGKYVSLLLFPHPLTNDYYPRHVDIVNFSNSKVLFSLLLYVELFISSYLFYKKDRVVSFGILFFIITLSIVSNIVFPIGTNMSERFLFMPSVGFCIAIVHVLYKLMKNGKTVLAITACFALILSVRTFTRNQVWKDDFTLYTTDVKVSKNSAKSLNAAGGSLTTKAEKEPDSLKKIAYLQQAVGYLEQAIKVHPTYVNPHQIMGNAYYYLKNYDKSISAYERAIALNPSNTEIQRNLSVIARDAGRYAGEMQNDLPKAKKLLELSYKYNPTDFETVRLLGVTNGVEGNHTKALEYFLKVVELDPKNAYGYVNIANAYAILGNTVKSSEAMAKAKQIDPNIK